MMTRYSLIRLGLAIVGLAAVLAGCNGQEDFSDAVISGDPLGSGIGAGANFQAADACAPRVVGVLVDAGTVSNVRYECDGFYGYTGVTGLPDETRQNFFVCPLGAKGVNFMLGGRTARLALGTGYFRSAQSINKDGCQYDYGAEEYVTGQYDADGIYLFSLSDLIDGPARIDAETPSATDDVKRVRNTSALLQALDYVPGDELISIDQAAHEVIFDSDSPYSFSADFLKQDYSSFVQSGGEAQLYLDEVQSAGGSVSLAGFPTEAQAVSAIRSSNRATNAGVYRFQMIQNSVADALLVERDVFRNPVLYGDGLVRLMSGSSFDPDAPLDQIQIDTQLYQNIEFVPSLFVSRRGHVAMGGSFNVVDVKNTGLSLCDDETVDYSTFDTQLNTIAPDLRFGPWRIIGDNESGDIELNGRIIGNFAFNGEERLDSTASDYKYIYAGLPAGAYEFNAATDRTAVNGTFCGRFIDDQPVLSLLRAGTITPVLDAEVMTALAAPQPMRYTLRYIARGAASDPEPNTLSASLDITIHFDGAIFSDLDSNGNPGYDGSSVPLGEYEIGMVSSIFRSPSASPGDVDEAVMNILVYNYGPISLSSAIPMYGSHFRARLVPDRSCNGENVLYIPTGEYSTLPDEAYWYDAYAAVDVVRSHPGDTGAAASYAGLRTRAYGYIEALRADCP